MTGCRPGLESGGVPNRSVTATSEGTRNVGCTTILVGKKASYDGSPLVARNEDSSNGEWNPKKIIVVPPADQPRSYTSVIGHLTIELPDDPMRYTAAPNAIPDQGIWGAAGINAANVAMSATETLTTNERVLGADPFVEYRPASGREGAPDYIPEKIGGIGEEDMLTIVLPYIRTAREGVLRLGALLEEHGTYEMNGIAFSDSDEIWWLETVGGHHWIAKRVPDDQYVTMPNQLGIDSFDLDDALGEGREHLASPDLAQFIYENHLNLSLGDTFNPRDAFGSHSDSDHVYNTARAWNMQRVLNPHAENWDGPSPEHTWASDDLPWGRVPERKLTIEDVKYVLSLHYQGTVYDPYSSIGTEEQRHLLRPIGINRHSQLSILQVRPYKPESSRAIQWVAFASTPSTPWCRSSRMWSALPSTWPTPPRGCPPTASTGPRGSSPRWPMRTSTTSSLRSSATRRRRWRPGTHWSRRRTTGCPRPPWWRFPRTAPCASSWPTPMTTSPSSSGSRPTPCWGRCSSTPATSWRTGSPARTSEGPLVRRCGTRILLAGGRFPRSLSRNPPSSRQYAHSVDFTSGSKSPRTPIWLRPP